MPTAENREDSPSISSASAEPPDIKTIMEQLKYFDGVFPSKAFAAAIANPELVTPALLEAIQNVIINPKHYIEDDPDYYAHMYAMLLLAQFREKRAYPLVATFLSLPTDLIFHLLDDFLTESTGRVLASVSCGDQTRIRELIENEGVSSYARRQAVQALVALVGNGIAERDDVLAYFKTLIRSSISGRPNFIIGDIIYHSLYLYPDVLLDDIREAFARGIVDDDSIPLNSFEEIYARGADTAHHFLKLYPSYSLIDDVISEKEEWARFYDDEDYDDWEDEDDAATWSQEPSTNSWDGESDPICNFASKVGPNDPCPCASGKKYKKCCGR